LVRRPGYFLAALTYPTSWAVPKQLIDQYADRWTDYLAANGGFGGNLYRVIRWDHTGHLDLERNERFWGEKPILRHLEYTLYKDTGSAWADYRAGKGDVGFPLATDLGLARTMNGSSFHQALQLAFSYLTPNWKVALAKLTLQGANVVRNHSLAKSISDAAWSAFLGILAFKAACAGKRAVVVPPAFTSQICSGCGVIVQKGLSVRWHACPDCGTSLHRDHNAALNILALGKYRSGAGRAPQAQT
jgi:Putative transposase DNA-binding domain